jgi:DNA-binding response OmpR family regulator
MRPGESLRGLRVLVAEDEMLISLLIEDVLSDEHCVVVGPFDRVASALEAARTEPLDLAVLDVNLAGVKVYPVAETLAERGIPFLLLSGYGQNAIPSQHPEWRACSKPFRHNDFLVMLEQLVQSPGRPK